MASSQRLQPCSKYRESQEQVSCVEHERRFPIGHLRDHREDLSKQFGECIIRHNQLQEDLAADEKDRQRPLLMRVDRWESESIERIKQAANDVRSQLRRLFSRSKRDIDEPLRQTSDELEKHEAMEDYTEMDLSRWMCRLDQLKNQLKKLPMLKIIEDGDSSTHIALVKLRVAARMTGKSKVKMKRSSR